MDAGLGSTIEDWLFDPLTGKRATLEVRVGPSTQSRGDTPPINDQKE